MKEILSPLELLAKLVCESAGARFIGVEQAIPSHSALILFCAANVPHKMQTTCVPPIFECSTHSIRERLQQALEEYRQSEI
jgi:hypothetical protein